MPSNEQRRDAAKRKLERRLERRTLAARKRKRLIISGVIVAVVVTAAVGFGVYAWKSSDNDTVTAQASPASTVGPTTGMLPPVKPKPAMVSCTYTRTGPAAGKPVVLPHTTGVKTVDNAAHVSVSITTSQGSIGLILEPQESPCTVNSFASLIGQGYFDHTNCHRLTTEGIKVLQCGDPTGTGSGGPGYQFPNEYPTDHYPAGSPRLAIPVVYPRGTVAMANAGAGTNGSQFFLVYGDSPLPPNYTVFGSIDHTGLATLDKIAAVGEDDRNGPGDGAPKNPVAITGMRLD